MSGLLPLFIGTTIFGVGVTLIDMLGLLGSQIGESSDDGDGADDADGDADADSDGDSDGDADMDTDTDMDTDSDADSDGDADSDDADADDVNDADDADDSDEADEADESEEASQTVIAHDYSPKKNVLLKVLTIFRNLVYFCFGFGPVGWFVFGSGSSGFVSLAWAIPMGTITLVGARLIKRLQRKKLDSQIHESELLMEKAEVLVSIDDGQLGKVRIFYGNGVVDRYAKAQDTSESYSVGSKVKVVSITDEYVIVSDKE